MSALWLPERSPRPSFATSQSTRRRFAAQSDNAMCRLSPAPAHRKFCLSPCEVLAQCIILRRVPFVCGNSHSIWLRLPALPLRRGRSKRNYSPLLCSCFPNVSSRSISSKLHFDAAIEIESHPMRYISRDDGAGGLGFRAKGKRKTEIPAYMWHLASRTGIESVSKRGRGVTPRAFLSARWAFCPKSDAWVVRSEK